MIKPPPFTLTNESITVIWKGKSFVVKLGAPNFKALRAAIINEEWDSIEDNLTPSRSVLKWAKGKFQVNDEKVFCGDVALPDELSARILQMSSEGADPQILLSFWEKLQLNPSMRSVTQLYAFLNNQGIPFTPDGNFLAYKSVKDDYKDHHSGKFDNTPGTVHEMPRNQISDDPKEACHEGFHVGALEYARDFGSAGRRIVICEVNPADVVCVPYDESCRKMRVSKYKVIGNHNGSFLSSTSYEADNDDSPYEENDADYDYDDGEEDDSLEPIDDAELYVAIQPVPVPKAKTKKTSKYSAMNTKALLDQSMADLRAYASKELKIVGASKIPGGKVALVSAIVKTRR